MICSRCSSTNCRSFEVVKQEGGVTVTLKDRLNTPRAQADLMETIEPPKNLFVKIGFMISWLVALCTLPIGFNWSYEKNGRLGGSILIDIGMGALFSFGVFMLMIVIFLVVSRIVGGKKRYDHLKEEWRNSFVCNDCGNVTFAEHVGQKRI